MVLKDEKRLRKEEKGGILEECAAYFTTLFFSSLPLKWKKKDGSFTL